MRLLPLALLGWAAPVVFAQQITVYSNDNVPVGTTRQLTAYVPLSPNTVVWSVNGVAGGDSVNGTVSNNGLYAAPAAIPANNKVVVKATSTGYPDKAGSATMTITQTPVNLWSI